VQAVQAVQLDKVEQQVMEQTAAIPYFLPLHLLVAAEVALLE
jgi:hypothetical protein